MGNIVGNQFGLVASKNQATAITDSKATGNEAKFYITKNNSINTGATCNAVGNAEDGIALTINGNVLRGMSKKQEETVNKYIDVNPATVYKFKGTVADYTALTKITSVKAGDVYNVTDPTSAGYPKETNFAATKDGTGATSGIWDSLGGISMTIATADKANITNDYANSHVKRVVIQVGTNPSVRNTAADSIEFYIGTGLTATNYLNGVSIEPSLGDGLELVVSSKSDTVAIDLNSSKVGDYAEGRIHSKLSSFISNGDALTVIGTGSDTKLSILLATNYKGNVGSNGYPGWEDAVPGLIGIHHLSPAGIDGQGLYISKSILSMFVQGLIDIAISSYLNAK